MRGGARARCSSRHQCRRCSRRRHRPSRHRTSRYRPRRLRTVIRGARAAAAFRYARQQRPTRGSGDAQGSQPASQPASRAGRRAGSQADRRVDTCTGAAAHAPDAVETAMFFVHCWRIASCAWRTFRSDMRNRPWRGASDSPQKPSGGPTTLHISKCRMSRSWRRIREEWDHGGGGSLHKARRPPAPH